MVFRTTRASIPLALGRFDANIARMNQTAVATFSQVRNATLRESLEELEERSRSATFVARIATSGGEVANRFVHHAFQRMMEPIMPYFARAVPTRVQADNSSGGGR